MSKTPTKKYRIFELEKEFNQSGQTIIEFLKKRKIKVANRFSAIDEEAYAILQESLPRRSKPIEETKPENKTDKPVQKNINRNRRGKFGVQNKSSIRLATFDDNPKTEAKKIEVKSEVKEILSKVEPKPEIKEVQP